MIAKNLGYLFEIGFNIGILAYIEHHKMKHNFGNLYRQDLENLKLSAMLDRLPDAEEIISKKDRKIIEQWSVFLIQKGFLSGLNFFKQYIKSTGWNQKKIEILYYQCSFCGNNSIKTYNKDIIKEYNELLAQFGNTINTDQIPFYIQKYQKQGEFLRSDTLLLLHYQKQYRIITVDLSIFSVKSATDLLDLTDTTLQNQRQILLREIKYLRSKSAFSKLRIDTGTAEDLDFNFSEDLKRYFTAFKRQDKESAKLIQAGSYAYSFYNFLQKVKILPEKSSITFNVVGYSDRGISAICLHPDNIEVLATCAQIYKNEPKDADINNARRQILDIIQRNAAKSFNDGKKFIKQLLEIPGDTISMVSHSEKITGFASTEKLRDNHAEIIKKALNSDDTYIFLTGNPGIGKTTAIADFLQTHINDGFLFLYVSPRKQVNLDIIEKFKHPDTHKLSHDNIFCINTNATLIKDNFPLCVVNYLTNTRQDDFTKNLVTFLNASQETNRKISPKTLKRITQDYLQATNNKSRGVLSTLCAAVNTVIQAEISNNIVATACIQSLKITQNGNNTLKHLENIFKTTINTREGNINPGKMRKISSRIKHLFIMIDEITGDSSGVEFLNGISNIVNSYELNKEKHGFNTKIIIADASIVDRNVITQHLSTNSVEPDKIFFRTASNQSELPLSTEVFKFKNLPARVINANSYPAKSLNITYKILVESMKFNEKTYKDKKDQIKKDVRSEIVTDIHNLWKNKDSAQILVYIQDKRELQELIQQIKNETVSFEKNQDYLEIHASISDNEKKEIQEYINTVKIVFMTSSASRGLSFPKAKHILVEIPRFQVENNLMEIIQVIYRCRGNYIEAEEIKTLDNQDKEIIFYLGDRAIYYEENNRQLALQESLLSLINILLILKTSIMTRIKGYGQIGLKNFLMIPIGGKSISAAGETFSGKLANLIKDLKNEHRRRPSYLLLKEVYTSLQKLLSQAEFVLNTSSDNNIDTISYLQLREIFDRDFSQLLNNGFNNLLQYGNIEYGHINGSLLVVPIVDQKLEEIYEIKLIEIASHASQELLDKMLSIRLSYDYPENLRSNIQNAIELIEKLREPHERTQWIEQNSQRLDQYYAIPLFSFVVGTTITNYFANYSEETEEVKFRDILATYIHNLYPADKTLPIGYNYRDFPFVIFSSYSLEEMREKIFTDKYLLTSTELNILNLILAKEIPDNS